MSMTLKQIEDGTYYNHLVNVEGFKTFHHPDKDHEGIHELYIVIPSRGVSISISYHDFNEGVRVTAAQGIHDSWEQSEHTNFTSIYVPDGDKL